MKRPTDQILSFTEKIYVQLNWVEFEGVRYHTQRIWNHNRKTGKPQPLSEFGALVGAVGEYVAGLGTKVGWRGDTNNDTTLSDLNDGITDVRAITTPGYCLAIKKKDPSEWRTILVESSENDCLYWRLVGFIPNEMGKQQQYWRGDLTDPCYLIPRSDLFCIYPTFPLAGHVISHDFEKRKWPGLFDPFEDEKEVIETWKRIAFPNQRECSK